MSSVPPPASAVRKPCFEGFFKIKVRTKGGKGAETTNRKDLRSQATQHTRMQAHLSFSDEPDPGPSFISIRDQTTIDGGGPHVGLLWTLPSVRMAEHELNIMFYAREEGLTVGVCVGDERARAAEEVGEEIAKDVCGCFAFWERG